MMTGINESKTLTQHYKTKNLLPFHDTKLKQFCGGSIK